MTNDMRKLIETVEKINEGNREMEAAMELSDIRDQIEELVGQAEDIIRGSGDRMAYERAKSYWIAHMHGALGGDVARQYLGGSMQTMADTIQELEAAGEQDDAIVRDDDHDDEDDDGSLRHAAKVNEI